MAKKEDNEIKKKEATKPVKSKVIKRASRTPKKSQKKGAKQSKKEPRVKKSLKVEQTDFQKGCAVVKEYLVFFMRRHPVAFLISSAFISLLVALYMAADSLDMEYQQKLPTFTGNVSFDFSIENHRIGRVDIGLFGTRSPLMTKNFIMLATHELGFGYNQSKIFQIVPSTIIMGGDIVNNDGSGGRKALNETIEWERSNVRHTKEGLVGLKIMNNNDEGEKSSQFYITLGPCTFFDGYMNVFGKVMNGMDVVREIAGSNINGEGTPDVNIKIEDVRYSPM